MHYIFKTYIILTIFINYTYTFDSNIYPILKLLFDNNKNYISRSDAINIKRLRLSKFVIDNTASNIVGPKNNNKKLRNYNNSTNVSKIIKDYSNFIDNNYDDKSHYSNN